MGAKHITLQPSFINTGAGGFGAHPGAHGELATRAPRELGPDDKVEVARTLPRGAQLHLLVGGRNRLQRQAEAQAGALAQTPPLWAALLSTRYPCAAEPLLEGGPEPLSLLRLLGHEAGEPAGHRLELRGAVDQCALE